ncbi:MAG TPA: type II toxin-antitoxin system PemK/MazF family toxin [Thermodesulfobacteriota bacterium]|nr:type II toxin-antitoxin system PemK/MazF family toxin [Thermodesulfobacteriota bacterium]
MRGIKRGSVWLVSVEPIIGRGIGKTRPAVVISNDINNEYAETVTVIPITSSVSKVYPFEVFLSKGTANLPKDSEAKCNQIRSVDKRRLIRQIGRVSQQTIKEIEKALLIHLGFEMYT